MSRCTRPIVLAGLIVTAGSLVVVGASCDSEPYSWTPILPGADPTPIPPPSSPENLVKALEVVYNDVVRSTTERLQAFENLLGPDFVFALHSVDWDSCGCESWSRDEVLAVHRNLFQRQENGEIYSFEFNILSSGAIELDPPEPGRDHWKEIFASNVLLQLLTSPDNGWSVGGQAEFKLQPLNRRWYIGECRALRRGSRVSQ